MLAKYLKESVEEESTHSISEGEVIEFAPGEEIIEFAPENGGDMPEPGADTPADDEFFKKLADCGFDTASGLSYCAGDADFYREMLSDYADGGEERIRELENALSGNDIKDYEIHVHSLKSVSKTVGAMDVYELAFELEQAAKNGDTGYINENHEKLKKLFRTRMKEAKP